MAVRVVDESIDEDTRNQSEWTWWKRASLDVQKTSPRRWDADAVVRVRGSPSHSEVEERITAETEADRMTPSQANTGGAVLSEEQRHRAVRAHSRMQGVQSSRGAGTRPQAHDEACRTRLMRSGEARNRILRWTAKVRHKHRAGLEACANEKPKSEERGEAKRDPGASGRSKNPDDGASLGHPGSGSEQQGANNSSSVPVETDSEDAAAVKRARSGEWRSSSKS